MHRRGALNGSTIPTQAPTWQPVAKCALGWSTLNVACGCGVSSAEYSVHLVGVNRLSACRELCGVHSWQNGTRCRDGGKVLWCHSHPVWLVCEGSIPTCICFVTCNLSGCQLHFRLELIWLSRGSNEHPIRVHINSSVPSIWCTSYSTYESLVCKQTSCTTITP